jgi:hypothetical protein
VGLAAFARSALLRVLGPLTGLVAACPAGPCLLVSQSKVRVLDGPPIKSGASRASGAPDLRLGFSYEGAS